MWGSVPLVPVSLPRQPVLWGTSSGPKWGAHPSTSSRIEFSGCGWKDGMEHLLI